MLSLNILIPITGNHNNIQAATSPRIPENQNYSIVQKDPDCNEITDGNDNYLQKAVESMVGKVESSVLIVDGVDLEEAFEKYCDECENEFEYVNSAP